MKLVRYYFQSHKQLDPTEVVGMVKSLSDICVLLGVDSGEYFGSAIQWRAGPEKKQMCATVIDGKPVLVEEAHMTGLINEAIGKYAAVSRVEA